MSKATDYHDLPPGSQRYLEHIESFAKGDILSVPVHTPTLHRNTQHRYRVKPLETPQGPVYSVRRLVIVLYVFDGGMICLPLYSFGLEGITAVPQRLQREYAALRDDDNYYGPGNNGENIPRIGVRCRGTKQMHHAALVHLLGSVEVRYEEDIVRVGQMSDTSFEELVLQHARAGAAGQQSVDTPWVSVQAT